MEEFSSGRADGKPSDPGEGGAAIRTPSKGDSSSPGTAPSDSPTLIDIPGHDASIPASDSPTMVHIPGSSDSPTMVDIPSQMGPDSPTMIDAGPIPGKPPAWKPRVQSNPAMLEPGAVLGQRYEILQILGEGGMGAVYKARDIELNRMVALKVIRPDLAGNQAIIDRFKQELVLATQVTHKNVIRIYDLSEAEGMKFITMEFVEGEDLRGLMQKKGKLTPEEAVEIMQQTCRALEAAHSAGIIHRDLKPQNIMRDKSGRILVMDFGLARTLEGDGMTQTGALVGTMDYMSPEQALGKDLDQRSDLFAMGLIFYELLTGKMPYKADSVVASLLKRTQERAAPVSSHDAAIPKPLSNIVSKCMEPDVKLRYQSSAEILADLDAWQGGRAAATLNFPSSSRPWGQTIPWHWIGGVVAAMVLAVLGFLYRDKLFQNQAARTPSGPVVSLAILPFRNASGDPALDWIGGSLAEILGTDMGQSAQFHAVPPDRMQQILHDLKLSPDAPLDDVTLSRLAEFSNADQILSGQYVRLGDHLRIDAVLRDLKHRRSIPLKIESIAEKDLPVAADQLARSVQENLNISSSVVQELRAAAFKPSTQSVQALRYYNEGLRLQRQGKNLEAVKSFEASTKEDQSFALAFARLGESYAKLGYGDNAAQNSQKALELSENLQPQEKYRIAASNALVSGNTSEAIKAYESLGKIAPGDPDVQFNLAELYQSTGAFEKARDGYLKLLANDPKYMGALLGLSHVFIAMGDGRGSLEYLNRAQSLAADLDDDEQRAAVSQALGTAYRVMNKPDDALSNYQRALDLRRKLRDKGGVASSLSDIAVVQAELLGKPESALASYQQALQLRREIGDRRGIGDTLLSLGVLNERRGKYEDALKFYKDSLEIEREVGDISREAQCLNNIGSRYLNIGEYAEALTYLQQALQFREKLGVDSDTSETLHNLGETSTRLGQFDGALDYYMRSLQLARNAGDKLGEAIESHSLGTLFEYQGRYGAALKSKEDAAKIVLAQDDKFWRAAILSSYGNTLALLGRYDDAQKRLEEALKLSREVQSDPLTAQTLNFQGDLAYYRGDNRGAEALFNQASQSASRSKDFYQILVSRTNLAKLSARLGRASAVPALKALAKETEQRRLKYHSALSSLYLGEALLNTKNAKVARPELESAVRQAQTLGANVLLAQAHGLLAKSLRLTGDTVEASRQEDQTKTMLDKVRQESQSNTLLTRSDLSAISAPSH